MKDYYKILKEKGFSDEEISDSFILPSEPMTEKDIKEISDFIKEIKKMKKERKLNHRITDLGEIPLTWGKKQYQYKFDSIDLLTVGDNQRDILIDNLLFEFRIVLQSTLFNGGMWGESSSKEMKESLEDITKDRKLEDLSPNEFDLLKKSGMLWEIFPESPNSYNDIKH